MQVLAGDIGGTKVLLQLAEFERGNLRVIAERRFESSAYSGLLPLLHEFLRDVNVTSVQAACFGIAGPISTAAQGQAARVTNLPWVVESTSIASELRIPHVRLINDFQAIGYGIEMLTAEDVAILQPGERKPEGPCAVVG